MHNKVTGRTQTGFTEVYEHSLSADFDLENNMAQMTHLFHDDHLCQIIFKSHHVWLSYGPDMILEYTNTHKHTHTHTHGQGKLYMPCRHFMAGA